MSKSDSTAVVTGGNSGIGRAVARRLAGDGTRVVIAARDRSRGEQTVRDIEEGGGTARFVQADVRSPARVEDIFEAAGRKADGIDFLFNNAGYEGPVAPLHELPPEEVDLLIDTNLKGAIHVLRTGLPHMNEGGAVVNNASFLGTVPFAGGPVYAASKAALIHLTKSVAEAYRDHGIQAYAVCPYNTATPMIDRLAQAGVVDREQLAGMNPSGDLVEPEEIASVVFDLMTGRREGPPGTAFLIDRGPEIQQVA